MNIYTRYIDMMITIEISISQHIPTKDFFAISPSFPQVFLGEQAMDLVPEDWSLDDELLISSRHWTAGAGPEANDVQLNESRLSALGTHRGFSVVGKSLIFCPHRKKYGDDFP